MGNNLDDSLRAELDTMVNDQFETPEYKRALATPFTWDIARFRAKQTIPFVINRRDCWAYAQARSPLDVKRVVWAHEKDELIYDERAGSDHPSSHIKEARDLGVPEGELSQVEPTPSVRAALYAWLHLATSGHWLSGLTASHILERQNDSSIVKGGGIGERFRDKMLKELGVERERIQASNVHVEADVVHTDMVWAAIADNVKDDHDFSAVVSGARESLYIMRAYLIGVLVDHGAIR